MIDTNGRLRIHSTYGKIESLFWLLYCLIIVIPLTSNLGFVSQGMIKIVELTIPLMFLCGIVTQIKRNSIKIRLDNISLTLIILFVLYFGHFIYGVGKYGVSNSINDFSRFLNFFIIYWATKKCIIKCSLRKFINMTIIGLAINGIVLLIIYHIFIPLGVINLVESVETSAGRFGVPNQTLYIIVIPIILMIIWYEKNNLKTKIILILIEILFIYLLFINGSRTIIGFTFINLISSFLIIKIVHIKKYDSGIAFLKQHFKFYIGLISFIIGGLMVILILNKINPELIQRFLDVINKTGTYSSFTSREITDSYYWNKILKNPFGYGFGSYMPLIDPKYRFYQSDWYYSDQGVITLIYKTGFLSTIVYLLLVLQIYMKFIRNYIKSKEVEYLYFIICLPLLMASIYLLSSQIIHAPVVYTFIWVLFSMITKNIILKERLK